MFFFSTLYCFLKDIFLISYNLQIHIVVNIGQYLNAILYLYILPIDHLVKIINNGLGFILFFSFFLFFFILFLVLFYFSLFWTQTKVWGILSYASPPIWKLHPHSDIISKSYKLTFHDDHLSHNTSYGSATTLQIFHLP